MSICRSEVLFSSMRDSMGLGMPGIHNTGVGVGQIDKNNVGIFGSNMNPHVGKEAALNEAGSFYGGASAGPKLLEEDQASSLILIQDSLINLSFSEQVTIQRNMQKWHTRRGKYYV